MKIGLAAALFTALTAATAAAQTAIAPLPPPVTSPPAPAPGSSLSPILTNPGLAVTPYTRATPSPALQAPAPINQQNTQAFRNELLNNQRMMDVQGVSPGSDAYRTNQQQLNQATRW
jgi:hypothetical protein